MFSTLIVIGLVGLVVMAFPALAHGAHAGSAAGGHGLSAAHPVAPGGHGPAAGTTHSAGLFAATRFLLSPRAVFSLLALYGACGNVLVRVAHLRLPAAAILGLVPAIALERWIVSPLWNLMFKYQGKPSSPLNELLLREGTAVTPFKNGRGLVAVERDGRLVQFVARLSDGQGAIRIRVGERVRIDEVDGGRECLVVSALGAAADRGSPFKQPSDRPD